MTALVLETQLLEYLEQLRSDTPIITTLSNGNPNRIVSVSESGVLIETEASKRKGKEPQLVEAWMINAAWDHLRSAGSLTNRHLLAPDGLNVKRSSAVCALLARMPGVSVASSRPIELRYRGPA